MALKMKPTSTIIANLGLEPNGRVSKFLVQTCAEYMDKYVPYREGNLRDYDIDGNQIIYNQPYAHYMYEGKLYVDPETGSSWARKDVTKVPTNVDLKYNTAGTGPHWDSRMWTAEGQDVVKKVQDYIRRK